MTCEGCKTPRACEYHGCTDPAQRIARLTEMARKRWADAEVFASGNSVAVLVSSVRTVVMQIVGPRALDMLEAALRAALDEQ